MIVQGGQDAQDALSFQVIFCKRALKLVALLRIETCNFRHSMRLGHPIVITRQEEERNGGKRESEKKNSPKISGFFTNRDLQLKAFYASWPPCSDNKTGKRKEWRRQRKWKEIGGKTNRWKNKR